MKYANKATSAHQESDETVQAVDYSKIFSEPTRDLSQSSSSDDVQTQPIDYSTRYSDKNSDTEIVRSPKKDGAQDTNSEGNVYGDYAETDLDQPTDYSLRYAEDDTDEDEKQNSGYFAENEVPEDTVKTYCTEGTPYETPFNFSTATSMSDLRVDDAKESDVSKKSLKKIVQTQSKENESTTPEETDTRIVNDNDKENDKNDSQLNSDQASPEKADNYCEEVVDKEGSLLFHCCRIEEILTQSLNFQEKWSHSAEKIITRKKHRWCSHAAVLLVPWADSNSILFTTIGAPSSVILGKAARVL